MIFAMKIDRYDIKNAVFNESEINPLKLIILFISMTILSSFLNEVGFFEYLALKVLNKVKNKQSTIFIVFSLLVAVLTFFASNDVVILTLTPLAIYFTKNAKVNPLPYVFSVLVFANTFSIFLIIGNPTNVYLATKQGIGFLEYFKVMFIPSLVIGGVSFSVYGLSLKRIASRN